MHNPFHYDERMSTDHINQMHIGFTFSKERKNLKDDRITT